MRRRQHNEDLPIAHEVLGKMIRGQDWGGMTSAYMQCPTGLDFCPLLKGLERDHCQCPHWGFVIEGSIRVNYEDGTEEDVGPSKIYYWPSGHTVAVEGAVRMVEFSPHDQMSRCSHTLLASCGTKLDQKLNLQLLDGTTTTVGPSKT
jgi:hypothetical protein